MLLIDSNHPKAFSYQPELSKILRKVQTELVSKRIQWIPQINTIIFSTTTEARNTDAITSNNRLGLPLSWASMDYATSFASYSTAWLPETPHWSIPISWSKTSPIKTATLQAIRRYWHPDSASMLSSTRILPPLFHKLPYLYLKSRHWKQFWSLPLSPRAFLPWWRLLQGKIAVQKFLHGINPTQHDSPICRICHSVPESEYHFTVGCPYKSNLWFSVLDKLSLSIVFPDLDEIWRALLFHKPTYFDPESGVIPNKFDNRHLQLIVQSSMGSGHITIPVLWQRHLVPG